MSAKKDSPFLKKSQGSKPPTRSMLRKAQEHGLGRGLDGLLSPRKKETSSADATPETNAAAAVSAAAGRASVAGTGASSASSKAGVMELPILEIERSPYQPRHEFKEEELENLAASIRANGLIQLPTVRRNAAGRYELIVGERRLRAAQRVGWTRVKVNLVTATDEEAAAMTATENIQREDLNPIEEGESYRMLIDTFGYTQEKVSETVGRSRPAIANAVRLLELPEEVKQLISAGLLSTGHAKVLLTLEGEKDRILTARDCVTDGLSVRALERRIARRNAPETPEKPRSGKPDLPDSYVRNLTETLHRHLGCAVRVTSGVTHANGKHTKGIMEIDFADNDDLDRLLTILGVTLD